MKNYSQYPPKTVHFSIWPVFFVVVVMNQELGKYMFTNTHTYTKRKRLGYTLKALLNAIF